MCKAYFSLVSQVRAEWDGSGIKPRWWLFMKWPSCKYLTALWCCPRQMAALNNFDYTSHSLHSLRNRSMWHLNTAATLVSFFKHFFWSCFFFNNVCWILSKAFQQHQQNCMWSPGDQTSVTCKVVVESKSITQNILCLGATFDTHPSIIC